MEISLARSILYCLRNDIPLTDLIGCAARTGRCMCRTIEGECLQKSVLMFYRIFFFLSFLLIIKIWHFSSTVLALSSLRSCIVGEWHPLSFSKLRFMLPTHEMLPLEQAQITLSLDSLRTVFLKIRNQQHISHMVSFIPVSSKFHNLHQCH